MKKEDHLRKRRSITMIILAAGLIGLFGGFASFLFFLIARADVFGIHMNILLSTVLREEIEGLSIVTFGELFVGLYLAVLAFVLGSGITADLLNKEHVKHPIYGSVFNQTVDEKTIERQNKDAEMQIGKLLLKAKAINL